MKIAIVHNLPSGGAKVVLYKWIEELQKRHTIDEYCPSSSDIEFYNTENIPHSRYIFKYKKLKRFPPDNRFLQYLNFLFSFIDIFKLESVYKNIVSYINARKYDVALVLEDRFAHISLCFRWLQKPTICYIQGYPFEREEGLKGPLNSIFNFLYPKYIKWLFLSNIKSASRVLVNSKNMQDIVAKVYRIKSEICYSGADIENFQNLNIKKENFILSVGALIPDKGHDFLIEALGKVNKNIRPLLKIVYDRGVEEYKSYLLSLANKNNVNISFASRIGPEELNILYNAALSVVCAQIHESLSRVPLEAMACGTPVIAINEGGFKETIINGETGILVEREIHKFASAITLLSTNKELREKYSKNAYKWIRNNWTWESHITKLETLILPTGK